MTIIIGLGNPGKKFEGTRHNVGFLVLDKFMEKNNFPNFKFSKKYNSLVSEKIIHEPSFAKASEGKEVVLVKPQTFMNDSGKAVKKIISNFKLEQVPRVREQISNLIVVHDDIDLSVGKIKIVEERGSAGHKGVESIIKNVGNENLARIRIGIAPQNEIKAKQIVLKKFSKKEQEIMNDVNKKTVEILDFLLQNGLEKAMNQYN